MTNQNPENLFRPAAKVALTPEEKSAIRQRLVSYMELTPPRFAAAGDFLAPHRRGFSLFAFRRGAAVAGLVIAVTLSAGGVSYAAEGALPGDTLYPVKVSVNEEVRAAFASNAEAKAAWEATRAERRLSEAEQLAERGRLNPAARAAVEAAFRRHAARVEARLAEIDETGDADKAAEVAAHLEGSLEGHRQVIAAFVAEKKAARAAEHEDEDDAEMTALQSTIDDQAGIVRRMGDRAVERAADRTEAESRRQLRRQEQAEKVIERSGRYARSRQAPSDSDQRGR